MKKINNFILATILAIVTVGMISCDNREFGEVNRKKSIKPNVPLSELNGGERIFTDAQIENIGKAHNEAVLNVFSNFDYSNINVLEECLYQFSQIDMTPHTTIELTSDEIPSNYNDIILKEHLSNSAYMTINRFYDDCAGAKNFTELENISEQTAIYAKENFTGVELDVVLTAISVARHSAELWFSQEKGGMGLGQQIIDKFKQSNPSYTPPAEEQSDIERLTNALIRCFESDADGAATSMCFLLANEVLAGAMGSNPVTVKATILAVVGSAAISSIYAAIKIIVTKDYIVPDNNFNGFIFKYEEIPLVAIKI